MGKKFYKDLKKGLEEILEYKKGNIKLHSEVIEIPEPPAEYKPQKIKSIRESGKYSPNIFARILNVSEKTIRSWEKGKSHPNQSALRLLEIIDKGIYRPEIYKKN